MEAENFLKERDGFDVTQSTVPGIGNLKYSEMTDKLHLRAWRGDRLVSGTKNQFGEVISWSERRERLFPA